MDKLDFRRLRQLLNYGWKDAKAISEELGGGKNQTFSIS